MTSSHRAIAQCLGGPIRWAPFSFGSRVGVQALKGCLAGVLKDWLRPNAVGGEECITSFLIGPCLVLIWPLRCRVSLEVRCSAVHGFLDRSSPNLACCFRLLAYVCFNLEASLSIHGFIRLLHLLVLQAAFGKNVLANVLADVLAESKGKTRAKKEMDKNKKSNTATNVFQIFQLALFCDHIALRMWVFR